MSVEQALRAVGASASLAKQLAPAASAAMIEGNITTQYRARYFIAQLAHESVGFRYREEIASGADYEGRLDLGNARPGDGRRFKGRGWIQVTGRSNYTAAGKALRLDLAGNPSLAARVDIAWRVAVWYWTTRNLNGYCDRRDFVGLTRRINGGTNGLADRKARLGRLSSIDCRPKKADALAGYMADEVKAIRTYDDWRRRNVNPSGRARLQAEMTLMRKRVWRAARDQPGGWDAARRRDRYRSLHARTA